MPRSTTYTPPTLTAFALATCLNWKIKVPDLEEFRRKRAALLGRDSCEGAHILYQQMGFVPLVLRNDGLQNMFWWCPKKFSSSCNSRKLTARKTFVYNVS